MSGWEIAAWGALAGLAAWVGILTGAGISLLIAALRSRYMHNTTAAEPGPPPWVNQGRILDDLQVDEWCRQLAEADDAAIWRELRGGVR